MVTDEFESHGYISLELRTWLRWIMRQRGPGLGCVVVMPMGMMVVMMGMAMLLRVDRARELNRARTGDLAMQFPTVCPSDKLQGVVDNPSTEQRFKVLPDCLYAPREGDHQGVSHRPCHGARQCGQRCLLQRRRYHEVHKPRSLALNEGADRLHMGVRRPGQSGQPTDSCTAHLRGAIAHTEPGPACGDDPVNIALIGPCLDGVPDAQFVVGDDEQVLALVAPGSDEDVADGGPGLV